MVCGLFTESMGDLEDGLIPKSLIVPVLPGVSVGLTDEAGGADGLDLKMLLPDRPEPLGPAIAADPAIITRHKAMATAFFIP